MLLRAALDLAHEVPRLRKPVVAAVARALFGPRLRVARFVTPRPRPEIEGLTFPLEMFEWLWYEDKDGNRIETTEEHETTCVFPENAHTMHTQFPHELRHNISLMEGGELGYGGSTWSDDVVTAMVRSGDWTAQDAIMVYAQSCERCMNVIAHHYGCGDGYPFGSDAYWETNTCCQMCLPIAGDPHPNPNERY